MMIGIAAFLGVIALSFVCLPFFMGRGGRLESAALASDPAELAALKSLIIKIYFENEASFAKGEISKRALLKRQQFLLNRYIDTTRRQDFLRAAEGAHG